MPQHRIFALILVVYALVGCSRIARLLDLNPSLARTDAQRQSPAVGNQRKEELAAKCCWCVLDHPAGQNSVMNYVGRDGCENLSNKPPYQECRSVQVEGEHCTLVRVSRRAGELHCEPTPLAYHEGGVKKVISPPTDYEVTCHTLALNPMTPILFDDSPGGAHPGNNGPKARGVAYCSCGRDPAVSANCRVVKIDGGNQTVLDSRPRGSGQSECSHEVCNDLFKQADYRGACPAYVHGDP